MTDLPDLAELRAPHKADAPMLEAKGLPRHAKGERFLKGPIPWSWLTAAGGVKGRALQVALVLWLEAGMKQVVTVKLTHARLREMGVDRSAARRGLAQLESLRLVSVVRRNGAAPRVTILNVETGATTSLDGSSGVLATALKSSAR